MQFIFTTLPKAYFYPYYYKEPLQEKSEVTCQRLVIKARVRLKSPDPKVTVCNHDARRPWQHVRFHSPDLPCSRALGRLQGRGGQGHGTALHLCLGVYSRLLTVLTITLLWPLIHKSSEGALKSTGQSPTCLKPSIVVFVHLWCRPNPSMWPGEILCRVPHSWSATTHSWVDCQSFCVSHTLPPIDSAALSASLCQECYSSSFHSPGLKPHISSSQPYDGSCPFPAPLLTPP